MKTHTHNKTTKLRKFLLMNIIEIYLNFQAQTNVYFIRVKQKKRRIKRILKYYNNLLIFIQASKPAINKEETIMFQLCKVAVQLRESEKNSNKCLSQTDWVLEF